MSHFTTNEGCFSSRLSIFLRVVVHVVLTKRHNVNVEMNRSPSVGETLTGNITVQQLRGPCINTLA